ncbi:MAG: hypothetical protein LBS24_00370 [Clostridiales Family XIII bacterium]|nr:hypothetical protein [Clostridiales Family XIII bacterium]
MSDETQKEITGAETESEAEGAEDFEALLFGDESDGETDGGADGDGDGKADDADGKAGDGEGSPKGTGTEDGKEAAGEKAGAGDKDGGGETGKVYEVTHLNRKLSVSEAEVVPLLQKGMDYDYVKSERDRMRGVLEFYAGQSGMSVADYMNYVSSNMGTIAHENAKQAIEAKHPDLDGTVVSEMAYAQIARRREAEAAQRNAVKAAADAARNEQFLKFVRKFPDVKIEDIPADVFAAVRGGANLTEEYSAYRVREAEKKIAELNAKQKAAEKNEENKSKALGSMETAAGENERDAFLSGFNS